VVLFGTPGVKLPKWFSGFGRVVRIRLVTSKILAEVGDVGLTEYREPTYSIRISSLERAMLEVLQDYSLQGARLLMQGRTR
jgi:hypothetical protein